MDNEQIPRGSFAVFICGLTVSLAFCAGCPTDPDPDPPGGETSAGTETGPGRPVPDVGMPEPEVPKEACTNPPMPPPPTPVPFFSETDHSEIVEVVPEPNVGDPLCPATVALFTGMNVDPDLPQPLHAEITRPALPDGSIPPGTFPLVVFTHGNGQDGNNYDALFADLTQRGFIVASIVGDGDVAGLGSARAPRLLCVAEALLDESVTWAGSGVLNGRYALTGHSTGGFGAFSAAAAVLENPGYLANHELVSVAALAPNPITAALDLTLGPNAPPYFVMQGTGDGDTNGAAPSHYDSVIPQVVGAEIVSAPRKAMVWAYNVEHSAYGGTGEVVCPTTAKGVALGTTYFNGFLVAMFYHDPEALDLFFSTDTPTPLIPATVADPSFWGDFGGVPQVYGTSSQKVDVPQGFRARIIDGFENGDPALSDAGLGVAVSNPEMYHEGDVGTSVDALHLANAAFIGWEDGNEIRWEMDFDMRVALAGATSLTFRAGAVAEIADVMTCSGANGSVPELTLLVSDGEHPEIEVDLTPYGRLVLPETRWEIRCQGFGASCHAWDLMQTTFRVPVGIMCDPNSGVFLSRIREVGLRLEGSGGSPRILLLDDVEIRSVPGEPDVDPVCRCPPEPQ